MFLSLWHTIRFLWQHPLNRASRLQALLRFLHWQGTAPGAAQPVAWPFVNDTRFYAARGWTGVTGNIYCGMHEFEEMAFVLHLLRSGDLFIDAGAHMGTYSILAAGVCCSGVIAIEPVNSTYIRLLDNLRLNGIAHLVQTVPSGLAARSGVARFHTDRGPMSSISTDTLDGEAIAVTTLDDLAADKRPEGLILLKLDVEGYESAVLEGAGELLQNPALKALIIELNGSGNVYGFSNETTHRQLERYGFRPYVYNPFQRILQPTESFGRQNTLYLREVELLQERIITADTFRVLGRKL